MELFERFPQLGKFTLHNEGRTVAAEKVLKIIE
jgi:translation elongation factor EF-1alpha